MTNPWPVNHSSPYKPEVWRERVFLLACKQNFNFFSQAGFVKLKTIQLVVATPKLRFEVGVFVSVVMQEFKTLSDEDLKHWPAKPWHPENKPPLTKWLDQEQHAEAKSRLHAVGNCVIPDMCKLALNILAAEQRAQR